MHSPPKRTELAGGQQLAGLIHLRATAIILVFLYHYQLFGHPAWVETAGAFGWTGVDLFFVLSGFLISGQLFKSIAQTGRFSPGEFYFKRVMRIIPAYGVVLACYFFFPWFREKEALPPLWKFLTFTQNIGLNLRTQRTFSHAWSLCIEEQFYLLLPLVLMGLRFSKKVFYLLAGLFVAGFIIRAFCYTTWVAPSGDAFAWYTWIYYPTWSRLDGLLAGIAIAGVFQFKPALKEKMTRAGNWWLAATGLLLAAAYWICGDQISYTSSVLGFPLVDISFGVLVLAALSPSCVLYRFQSRISYWIATLSYSIYLVHKGCIHVAQQQLAKLGVAEDGTLMFFLCIAATMTGALLLHFIIERPFLQLRDRALTKYKNRRGHQTFSTTSPPTG